MHSLEIVPKQLDRLKFLPEKKFKDIFVAFIPGDSYSNIVDASKSLVTLFQFNSLNNFIFHMDLISSNDPGYQ